ncbi:zinc ribbon domain-containing protein [Hyphomonas oceanitis]|uniref:Band 7 domain-containing protein n=1 Tax=Hyphomonas oceanitis SCH89 TaxID=1280953 RepID=A0A059G531_9PROT|nr:zinc ribbon domain-containing protein [Hyphomonas oceanitis]KDA01937.1 hypothetical protein HOC_12807 [Hyphomonas oceanitis SCH89]
MASEPIVLSDPRMLAEFMRQSEFKAFFEKRFAVPPDYAALLFKNGQLIDAFKGGHFSVGGVADKLKGLVGGSTHIGMMIADLKPFSVQTALKAMSKDKIEIAGVATLELQVDPDKPSNILGMMHGVSRSNGEEQTPGRKALSKADVLDRIRPHLSDRVFEAAIGRMDAAQIRGETGLQDKIQADIMLEVERIVGDLGLIVRAVSLEWATNTAEVAEMERADADRRQDALDHQLEIIKREIERENDATEITLKSQVDLAKLQSASEDELKHMALNSEIEFLDAREGAKRRQELEALGHEINTLEIERAARFEDSLATARNDAELLEIRKRQAGIESDIALIQQSQADQMRKSGAFTELEITAAVQKQQADHIARLQQIELQASEAETNLAIRLSGANTQNEIDVLDAKGRVKATEINAFKSMSPEQILAINAGLSTDVAQVLAEQARAKGQSSGETMQAMRDMVEAATAAQIRSEAQARDMFRMGMDGAVGVAHGAGGKEGGAPASSGSSAAAATSIECAKCSAVNLAKANFCKQCGHKLRT